MPLDVLAALGDFATGGATKALPALPRQLFYHGRYGHVQIYKTVIIM